MKKLKNIENSLNVIFNRTYINLMKNEKYNENLNKITTYVDPYKDKKFFIGLDDFFLLELRNKNEILLKESSSSSSYYAPTDLINNKIIPFACDAGGYLFCFDYRQNNNKPLIILWIRDNPDNLNIAHLANSFEEFINKLKSEDELDLD